MTKLLIIISLLTTASVAYELAPHVATMQDAMATIASTLNKANVK